jgi:kinase-associated protein B
MVQVGDQVIASYNSGEYFGEVVELTPSNRFAVKILAVIKHPDQGDLHHPMKGDARRFFQRRALAYSEITLVDTSSLRPYNGDIPEYQASLLQALEREMKRVQQIELWAHRSLDELKGLAADYGFAEKQED